MTEDAGPCPSESALLELLEGTLAVDARADLAHHLDHCDACRDIVSLCLRSGHEVASDTTAAPARGSTIGAYVVEERLGAGAMGVVVAARDVELERRVAIKLLHPGLDTAPEVAERLVRESRAMAKLAHENVVAVHHVGRTDDRTYLVMELVPGPTLRRWLADAPREVSDILRVFRQAAAGLAAAHAAGLVHRDFKTDNVLLTLSVDGAPRARVADFGLASSGVDEARAGGVFGTPAYMAPEQHRGAPVTDRADVFSFSVSLFEALTDTHPFLRARATAGATQAEVVAQLVRAIDDGQTAAWPPRAGVSRTLRALVHAGMAASPAARPPMSAFVAALDVELRPPARPARVAAVVALAVVLVVSAGFAVWRTAHPACPDPAARLVGLWDEPRRASLRALFGADPQGEARWRTVHDGLDAYARAWVDAARDTCALHASGAQSDEVQLLRVHCLESRRDRFAALVDLLGKNDPAVLTSAEKAVARLGRLEACSAVEVLEARVPVPNDDATRARVAALRQQLAEVEALRDAGRNAQAQTRAAPLVGDAQAVGYQPLVAEALHALGRLQAEGPDPRAGVETLRQAALAGEASRHDEVAASAWVTTMKLATFTLADVSLARDSAQHARASLERLGRPARLQAYFRYNEGIALWELEGKADEALSAQRDAYALWNGRGEEDASNALYAMAVIYRATGRTAEAVQMHERVLAMEEKASDPDHPRLATHHSSLALALVEAERFDDAIRHAERAVALQDKEPVPQSLAAMLVNLGETYRYGGRLDDALRAQDRAIALLQKAFPEPHPFTGAALLARANVLLDLERSREAVAAYVAALAVLDVAAGKDALTPAQGRVDYARALLATGDVRGAQREVERAAAALAELVGEDHPAREAVRALLADLAKARRQRAR